MFIENGMSMEKVFEFIKQHKMFKENDKVVAGISGGADSVCLLFVLLELRKKMNIDIVAVHVNHQIRGEAALHDEKFTVDLCKKYGVKCVVVSEDVPALARKRKQSLEEAGRDLRREAFAKVLEEEHADKIAMAHHENDNAETFIMHLIRGAGLNGLSGIWPVNGNVVRPLLCVTRKEIEDYVTKKGVTWCDDLTNDEDDYTRNRIRHQVIPVLESETGGNAVKHINGAMDKIREALLYIQKETETAYKDCVKMSKNGDITINKEKLYTYHDMIRKDVIKEALYKAAGHKKDIGKIHFDYIEKLFERQSGKRCDLPYGVTAVRNYDGIILKKESSVKENNKIKETELIIPGETFIKDSNIKIVTRIIDRPDSESMCDIPQKTYTKWFDYGIIKCKLVIRRRVAKDIIGVGKDGGSKKIKSYFIDEKIPAAVRDSIPLIADGSNILWVVGHRMSSCYQITKNTRTILEIKVLEEK